MIAALRYLLPLAAIIGALYWAFSFGVSTENARRKAEVAGLTLQHSAELREIDDMHQRALQAELERARQAEAAHAQAMADLDRQHTEEMTDAQAKADADLAAVRAGTIRVRDRLTCASGASDTGASGAAGQTGGPARVGDAAPQGGLSGADVELVLRLGAEADIVARQLSACQAIVRGDRAR